MGPAFWKTTYGKVTVLSYTAVCVCVILQTIILGVVMRSSATDEKPPLLVISSASVITTASLKLLLDILYPPRLWLNLCLFEIPVLVALLSAILSLAAPLASAFVFSITSSVIISILTVLRWII